MTELTDYRRLVVKPMEDLIKRQRETIEELAKRVYWQTIDTAPSDGREVLVCGSAYKEGTHLREADGDWWRRQACEGSKSVPTHWMEKPAPFKSHAGCLPHGTDPGSSRGQTVEARHIKALEEIAGMDPKGLRADDLGRAARIASDVITSDVGGSSK
jgi:hypothetical protein